MLLYIIQNRRKEYFFKLRQVNVVILTEHQKSITVFDAWILITELVYGTLKKTLKQNWQVHLKLLILLINRHFDFFANDFTNDKDF